MRTFLNNPIHSSAIAILYLCEYNHTTKTIKVVKEMQFKNQFEALDAYSNIPNPESQLAAGKDKPSFEYELALLHSRLNNPEWVKDLSNYI